jgi:hypothetical protein
VRTVGKVAICELSDGLSPARPVVAIDVDLDRVAAAQAAYPCYVPELAAPVTTDRAAPSPRR